MHGIISEIMSTMQFARVTNEIGMDSEIVLWIMLAIRISLRTSFSVQIAYLDKEPVGQKLVICIRPNCRMILETNLSILPHGKILIFNQTTRNETCSS